MIIYPLHNSVCDSKRDVCTVILNWNQPEMTARCVEYVQNQSYHGQCILVVDNGSAPVKWRELQAGLTQKCEIIRLSRNCGFAGGMNYGIKNAIMNGHKYIWLLNNDAFPEHDCLAKLVLAIETDQSLAAVSPYLYGTDQKEQHAGGRIIWDQYRHELLNSEQMSKLSCYGDWLTGTALLIRSSALHEAGLLDENYFAYWEEVDLMMRLSRLGYSFVSVPSARCLHLGSASTGSANSAIALHLLRRNAWYFFRKHGSSRNRTATFFTLIADWIEEAASHLSKNRLDYAHAVLAAVSAVVTNKYGPPHLNKQLKWIDWVIRNQHWRLTSVLRRFTGTTAVKT